MSKIGEKKQKVKRGQKDCGYTIFRRKTGPRVSHRTTGGLKKAPNARGKETDSKIYNVGELLFDRAVWVKDKSGKKPG